MANEFNVNEIKKNINKYCSRDNIEEDGYIKMNNKYRRPIRISTDVK